MNFHSRIVVTTFEHKAKYVIICRFSLCSFDGQKAKGCKDIIKQTQNYRLLITFNRASVKTKWLMYYNAKRFPID